MSLKRKTGRPANKLVNEAQLMQMLSDGKTQQQCADEFNVSVSTIKYAHNKIKAKLSNPPAPVSEGKTIDALDQLTVINTVMISALKRLGKMIHREDEKMAEFDRQVERLTDNPDDLAAKQALDKLWDANTKSILALQTNSINVSAETRKQIELQLKIAEAVYNIEQTIEFQNEIIGILREVEPTLAQRVITKLKERRSIRGLVRMG